MQVRTVLFMYYRLSLPVIMGRGGLGDNPPCLFFSSYPRSFYLSTNFLPLTVLSPRDADKTVLKRESAQQLMCVNVCVSVCACACLYETTPMGESESLRIISSSLNATSAFSGISLDSKLCVCMYVCLYMFCSWNLYGVFLNVCFPLPVLRLILNCLR